MFAAAAAATSAPTAVEPVNATLSTSGVRGQRLAHRGPEPGHHVEHARREPGLVHQRGQLDRGGGGVVARLGHHRAARGQRRGQLPAQQQQRGVPRHDRRDHAGRLAPGVDEEVRLVARDGGALELVGQPGEVVEPLRDAAELPAHLAQQLAGVPGLDLGQPVRVPRDQVAEPAHQRGPAEPGELAPRPGQRPAGRGDGGVDVGGVAVGGRRPRRAQVRVDRVVPLPGRRLDPAPVDDELVSRQFVLSGRRHDVSSQVGIRPGRIRCAGPAPGRRPWPPRGRARSPAGAAPGPGRPGCPPRATGPWPPAAGARRTRRACAAGRWRCRPRPAGPPPRRASCARERGLDDRRQLAVVGHPVRVGARTARR